MTENKKIKKAKLSKEVLNIKEGLHFKEIQFVDFYIKGHTPIEALELSGLSVGEEGEDAKTANKLISNPTIRGYIQALENQVASSSAITLEMIDRLLFEMISVDIADLVDITYGTDKYGNVKSTIRMKDKAGLTKAQKAAIGKIRTNRGELEIETSDKLKLAEMLIKRRGGFKDVVDVNANHNVKVYANVGNNGRQPKSD